jgi:hypothetical protein
MIFLEPREALDPFQVGVVSICPDTRAVYDFDLLVEYWMERFSQDAKDDGEQEEIDDAVLHTDAVEWVEINVIGLACNAGFPLVLRSEEDLYE